MTEADRETGTRSGPCQFHNGPSTVSIAVIVAAIISLPAPCGAARTSRARSPAAPDPIAATRALFRDGRYMAAESLATIAMARGRASPGKDSLDYAAACDVFSEAGWRMAHGMYGDSRDAALAAARIRERVYGAQSLEYAAALMNLGELENACQRFEPARRYLEGALAIRETRLGPNRPETAASLTALARAVSDSNAAAAHPMFERAFAIRESTLTADDPELARGWYWLAWSLRQTNQLPKARVTCERTLDMQRRMLPPNHPSLGSTLYVYGSILRLMNDLGAARVQLEDALAIREKALGPAHPDVGWVLRELGSVTTNLGDQGAAREALERAAAIFSDPDHPMPLALMRIRENLGYLFTGMDQMREARRQLDTALVLCERYAGPDSPLTAGVLGDLGTYFLTTGAWEEAEAALRRGLAITTRTLGPQNPRIGFYCLKLGTLASLMGRYASAESLLVRSIQIKEQLGPSSPDLVAPLVYLCEARYRLGDYSGARQAFDRMQPIALKAGRKIVVSQGLVSMSRVDFVLGDEAHARALMLTAIRDFEDQYGPQHSDVGNMIGDYATLLAHGTPSPAILDTALIAERITRDFLRLTVRGQSERQSLDLVSAHVSGLSAGLTVAAIGQGDAARAWDGVIRSRALVLDEMAARRRRASGGPLAHALEEASARLAELVVGGPGKDPVAHQHQVDEARREKERIEGELGASDEADPLLDLSESIGFEDVASHLPEGSALVAYAVYDHLEPRRPPPPQGAGAPRVPPEQILPATPSYLAFVLAPGSREPRAVRLGTRARVDSLVERWGKRAGRDVQGGHLDEPSYRVAGEALRRAIWDPLASQLGGARRVFIVPDGTLHLVNLEALPARRHEYLVESGPLLHMLATERDLVTTGRTTTGKGLLAVGGPDFDGAPLLASAEAGSAGGSSAVYRGETSECNDLKSAHWPPLPGTLAEARAVAALWSAGAAHADSDDAEVLTGAAADEASFKHMAPGRRVLHLATHGFFLDTDCAIGSSNTRGLGGLTETKAAASMLPVEGSGKAASPATKSAATQASTTTKNHAIRESPLLLSGLVLAGANLHGARAPGEDDGILTAEEIAALDLRGLEWAVLSACETGVGEVRSGEGVLGLRRAFQVAGAHTTIMSLWPVDDASTEAWMKALYEARFARGLDTAEAVRAASLAVLRERRAHHENTHPFYWGAFVAAGDWR
jgi:CHAT domain-containing protein/tetratricopeptide (TPR) repeat protein